MKKINVMIILLGIIFIEACSTAKTINPANDHVTISHRGHKSYCHSIPRVYSGVSRNVCKAHGEPSRRVNIGSNLGGISVIVMDTFFSAIVDTLVLPYTVARQINEGNIQVN